MTGLLFEFVIGLCITYLADDIENGYYTRGYRKELIQEILQLDPDAKHIWGTIDQLRERIIALEEKQNKSSVEKDMD
jgi:hypothetical protein